MRLACYVDRINLALSKEKIYALCFAANLSSIDNQRCARKGMSANRMDEPIPNHSEGLARVRQRPYDGDSRG
jgi:hypothetical protein